MSDFATVIAFFSTYGTAGLSSWMGIGSSAINFDTIVHAVVVTYFPCFAEMIAD